MRRITILILCTLLWVGPTAIAGEDGMDTIPAMSWKVQVMEELGLIEHEIPGPKKAYNKKQKEQKKTPETVQPSHLADTNSWE